MRRADTRRTALGTATFAALALAPNQQADTDGNREMNRRLIEDGHGNGLLPEPDWFPQARKEYHHGFRFAVPGDFPMIASFLNPFCRV